MNNYFWLFVNLETYIFLIDRCDFWGQFYLLLTPTHLLTFFLEIKIKLLKNAWIDKEDPVKKKRKREKKEREKNGQTPNTSNLLFQNSSRLLQHRSAGSAPIPVTIAETQKCD